MTDVSVRNKTVGEQVRKYLDTLTKPKGSLGRLEDLVVELAEMTGERFPEVTPPGVIVFAADHGIVGEGVSAYPQEVTAQMVANFLEGGSAINVLSRSIGAKLAIVDVGVAADVRGEGLIQRKLIRGTKNFLVEDAMSRREVLRAVEVGKQVAAEMIEKDGVKCLIPGEMGIGNTTASSAVLAALSGESAGTVTGAGTGISEDEIVHKTRVIEKALARRRPDPEDAVDVLAKVGGPEITAMGGAILAAAVRRIPVLLDGFISTTAAAAAVRMVPEAKEYLIASHRSAETGHEFALGLLEKRALLDVGMRLGEGSGAALAFPILTAACRLLKEMATFESAGVSERE
jgi:nicotinate-nucleotide--dimethylbenzimidazole phosphoribosyltransferase